MPVGRAELETIGGVSGSKKYNIQLIFFIVRHLFFSEPKHQLAHILVPPLPISAERTIP
jgi:hypothetical protein